MKLTILGNNGPFPAPGHACSGYLVSHKNVNVLVDCGLGVMANLQKHISLQQLSAVVFTHLHFDHASDGFDLPFAARALGFPVPPIYAPETPQDVRAFLPGAVFETSFEIGDMKFTLYPARHPIEAYSIGIECEGKRLVLTGDTNMHDALPDILRGADFLLADAAFLHCDWAQEKPHLSARLCGQLAQEAGVGELVLTHLFPTNDPAEVENEAREYFPKARVAVIDDQYEI